MLRHTFITLGLFSTLLGCAQAPEYLEALQTQIQDELAQQGGSSLKSVICPVPENIEDDIVCVGILPSGNGVDISVTEEDEKVYAWRIPSIKGLLNMQQVQETIEAELGKDLGNGKLDCGVDTAYKVAQPGEQFDCVIKPTTGDDKAFSDKGFVDGKNATKIAAKNPVKSNKKSQTKTPATQPKVEITILPSGDINWQQIGAQGRSSSTSDKPATTPETSPSPTALPTVSPGPDTAAAKITKTDTDSQTADTPTETKAADTPPPPSAKPAQSAEEALNAADALEGWDD